MGQRHHSKTQPAHWLNIQAICAQVQDEILRHCPQPISQQTNFWRALCLANYSLKVTPLPQSPSDWNSATLGRFEARLIGDPRDLDAPCRIDYLSTGTQEQRVARIIHELAEYLLLIRLPQHFDADSIGERIVSDDSFAVEIRHKAAREIETAIIAMAFPPPKMILSKSIVCRQQAIQWHAAHPNCDEPEHVQVEGIDYFTD